jgi:hypothetical protein
MGGGQPNLLRCSRSESVLQAALETFYHDLGLRVVGSSLFVLYVEQVAEGGPQGGGELVPSV